MLKTLALATALSALLAGGALAQSVDDPDECMNSTFELAQAAEDKQLSEDQSDKVEELLIKMEDHCEGNRYTEAKAVAEDLKLMIDKQ
jgi:hypothetical protein